MKSILFLLLTVGAALQPAVADAPWTYELVVTGPNGLQRSVCVITRPCRFTNLLERTFVQKGERRENGRHELHPSERKVGLIVEVKGGEIHFTRYFLEGEKRIADGADWMVAPAQKVSRATKSFTFRQRYDFGEYSIQAAKIIH